MGVELEWKTFLGKETPEVHVGWLYVLFYGRYGVGGSRDDGPGAGTEYVGRRT